MSGLIYMNPGSVSSQILCSKGLFEPLDLHECWFWILLNFVWHGDAQLICILDPGWQRLIN